MNVIDKLIEQEARRPNQAAIIDEPSGRSRITTFAQLARLTRQTSTFLAKSGLRPGDGVLVLQPMSLELYVALLSVFHLRLVAMFLDPGAGLNHIERCCAIGEPKAMIASNKALVLLIASGAMRRIEHKIIVGSRSWNGIAGLAECHEPCLARTDSPALLTFTSGSTGQPKAAVRTHGFLMAQHTALEKCLQHAAGSVDMAALPIFVLANLASGVTSIIPNAGLRAPGSIDPEPVVAQIAQHRPATLGASPAFLERIADHCLMKSVALDGVETIFTRGAPVFPKLLDKLQRVASHTEIVAVYGSTEAEPIAHIKRSEISDTDRERMCSGGGLLAGTPESCVRLRVLKDRWGQPIGPYTAAELEHSTCAEFVAGEIVVTGDHVLKGYLNGHGDSESKFRVTGDREETWHRTGDAGCVDDLGRLWLLGRCSAKIDDERGTVYPFAIETAIHDMPGVKRAAAVGRHGRRIVAIERIRGAGPPDVARIKHDLAWAQIDEVCLVRLVPVDKRHNAKIDYPALFRMLGISN